MNESSEHEAGPATPLPQHTPGPWHYDPEFGEIVSFVERPFPELSGRYIVAESITRRNGPAIAALPGRLAAGKAVVRASEEDGVSDDVLFAAFDALEAAIAKAEGREQ